VILKLKPANHIYLLTIKTQQAPDVNEGGRKITAGKCFRAGAHMLG